MTRAALIEKLWVLGVAAAVCGAGCGEESNAAGGTAGTGGAGGTMVEPTPAARTIVGTAMAAGGFDTLVAALTAADLVTTIEGTGPFTVFAPTDAAFAKLPAGTLATLLRPENQAMLQAVLKYHVVAGRVGSTEVAQSTRARTLQGPDVVVTTSGATVKLNDATVVTPDVSASNGVIHVIDTVLMPPSRDIVDTAVAAGTFTKLAAALTAADLVTTLKGEGPFTVFAPTDAAFDKLPAGTVEDLLRPENKAMLQAVLKYHVVPGAVYSGDVAKLTKATTMQGQELTISGTGGIKVDDASITGANILGTNGVIHVIDSVLLPK